MVVTVLAVLIVLLLLGLPVAYVLGITGTTWIMLSGNQLATIANRLFDGINSFTFLAIPFFILAGEVMNKTNITSNLIKFVNIVFGRFRGALAQANVYASLLFAGLTGAAISDVSALGSIFIPAMHEQGYKKSFAAAITATTSVVGPIIPPSIVMVMYGGITGESIGALFIGAVIPGILVGLGQSVMVGFMAKKHNYPKFDIDVTFKEFVIAFRDALVAIIMPFIIIGGILLGVFTPTEAAAVAVAYALILGFLLYRSINLRDLYDMFAKTVRTSGTLFFIIAMAKILSWIVARTNLPGILAEFLLTAGAGNPTLAFLYIIIFLLFMGTWMETGASVVLLAPIFAPIMLELGFHPIHFGVTMAITLNIGLVTPPLGVCLFAASSIADVSFESVAKEAFPYLLLLITSLILIAFFPELTLWLPRMAGLL